MKVKMFGIVFLVLLTGGCVTFDSGRIPSSAPTSSPAEASANKEEYISLPFKKVINPAFVEEVSKKWIRCKVRFSLIISHISDLPQEYREGWIRFQAFDVDATSFSNDLVISKENSNKLFELKSSDQIEILAYVVPTIFTDRITGRLQKSILLRVEKIKLINSEKKK